MTVTMMVPTRKRLTSLTPIMETRRTPPSAMPTASPEFPPMRLPEMSPISLLPLLRLVARSLLLDRVLTHTAHFRTLHPVDSPVGLLHQTSTQTADPGSAVPCNTRTRMPLCARPYPADRPVQVAATLRLRLVALPHQATRHTAVTGDGTYRKMRTLGKHCSLRCEGHGHLCWRRVLCPWLRLHSYSTR